MHKDVTRGNFDSHSNLILFPTSSEIAHRRQSQNLVRMLQVRWPVTRCSASGPIFKISLWVDWLRILLFRLQASSDLFIHFNLSLTARSHHYVSTAFWRTGIHARDQRWGDHSAHGTRAGRFVGNHYIVSCSRFSFILLSSDMNGKWLIVKG